MYVCTTIVHVRNFTQRLCFLLRVVFATIPLILPESLLESGHTKQSNDSAVVLEPHVYKKKKPLESRVIAPLLSEIQGTQKGPFTFSRSFNELNNGLLKHLPTYKQ